jgi:hypothetical protein
MHKTYNLTAFFNYKKSIIRNEKKTTYTWPGLIIAGIGILVFISGEKFSKPKTEDI